ncbi:MAG: hypothetical protein NVSMB65_03020 [Chloroflexota bacterium]
MILTALLSREQVNVRLHAVAHVPQKGSRGEILVHYLWAQGRREHATADAIRACQRADLALYQGRLHDLAVTGEMLRDWGAVS